MTSDKSEFTRFKEIASGQKKSTFHDVSKVELEDEVLEAMAEAIEQDTENIVVDPPKKEEPKKVKNQRNATILKSLRFRDDTHQHTCAACMKTLPVEDFERGKRDNVCVTCGGK